jgi:hypothetical protein
MDERKELIYENSEANDNSDNSNSLRNSYNNNNKFKNNIQDLSDKDSSEPDILFFLNSEPESVEGKEILRKCINFFYEKKWESLIHFLEIGGKNNYNNNKYLYKNKIK